MCLRERERERENVCVHTHTHRAAKARWGDACHLAGTCRTQEKVRAPNARTAGKAWRAHTVYVCMCLICAAQADALKKLGIEAFPFDIDGEYLPLKGRALETLLRRSIALSLSLALSLSPLSLCCVCGVVCCVCGVVCVSMCVCVCACE